MLLAIYQKMRLIRERNQLTLNLASYSTKLTRIEKNIKNTQKLYAAKIKNLETMAKMEISAYKNASMMRFNNGSLLASLMEKGLEESGLTSIWDAAKANNLKVNADGQYEIDGQVQDQEDIKKFQSIYNQATYNMNMQQQMAQMDISGQEQLMTAQLEAAKEQLEDEQDMALSPLEYEQTMMELDKEATEQRLARIDAEIKSYDELCRSEAQNSAPKFGLS